MADIKKTLPQSVGESRGIGEILDSCGTELELLEQEARAACLRLAAATADSKGCALWERELGLEVREDLPLSARRVLIQVALEQMDTCTPEKLRAFVLRMLEGQVELREDFEGYTVYLAAQVEKFLVPSLRYVEKALRRATPAHLDCVLSARADLNTDTRPRRALLQGIKLEIYTKEEESA
ncbi:MAG: DUF2313 domain-containing protein [Clostridia bacterium]|nr:DUF2313 domain-containing protein [Clostridia bacterium]